MSGMDNEIAVGWDVLRLAEKHYSAMLLDMHHQEKSRGKVFRWQGGWWTMTGGCYQGGRTLYVKITQVVPEASYTGPVYDREKNFYTGGRLNANGAWWVMTEREIHLVPNGEAKLVQIGLFDET